LGDGHPHAPHAELLHDPLGRGVAGVREADEVVVTGRPKEVVAARDRRLRGVARSPQCARQPPSDLGLACELRERLEESHAAEARKRAVRAALDGPTSEAVLVPTAADPAEHVRGLRTVLDVTVPNEAHDVGVGVHYRESIEILIAPPPQDQPFGLEPTFG
jgi:hypothetical protein